MEDVDLREKLAHIDQMLADIDRAFADRDQKRVHIEQLLADRDRKRQEIRFAPWQIAAAMMTAGAALFAAHRMPLAIRRQAYRVHGKKLVA